MLREQLTGAPTLGVKGESTTPCVLKRIAAEIMSFMKGAERYESSAAAGAQWAVANTLTYLLHSAMVG